MILETLNTDDILNFIHFFVVASWENLAVDQNSVFFNFSSCQGLIAILPWQKCINFYFKSLLEKIF